MILSTETYLVGNLEASSTPLEKAMAPHSSPLAWKIPWAEEPGGLQSMGSWIVGHDWVTSLSLFSFMHWRRKWQPTPVFLPGESQGRGSLVGCRLWGRQSRTWLKGLSSSSSSTPLTLASFHCFSITFGNLSPRAKVTWSWPWMDSV